MSTTFQLVTKRVKKQTEDNIYERYGTGRGGRGAKIDMIKKVDIIFYCYIIECKTMRYHMKKECMLDAILVAENCCQGEILNWSTFVLNELFEACEYVYRWETIFVFEYILMSLVMWKWSSPKEREMMTIVEGQLFALCYDP